MRRKRRRYEKPFELLVKDGARRLRLIKERGHRCEICELTEWMEQAIPLELDHIDGNSDNNDRSNLRVVCPNCHAQTDTYCGKNIGRRGLKRKQLLEKYPNYRV